MPFQPPASSMAEWEEVAYVVLTWTQYTPVLREVVRYAQEECEVLIICLDSTHVIADLQAHHIPLKRVQFIEEPYNSVWMRDYGPHSVYVEGADSLVLIDWAYNRPRPQDDVLSRSIAEGLQLPLKPLDLVHIGGNFITDGLGRAFSSRLVLSENVRKTQFCQQPKTEAEIDLLMLRYLGIHEYVKLVPLPFDPIDHLDMHMMLLDEKTLLVGQYPSGVADGPQIEANLQLLQQIIRDPYRVVRMPMPAFQGKYPDTRGVPYLTYTNAVFINRTVLVPQYELPSDSLAMAIYQSALPGYRVVGINCRPIIIAGGALHCITRTIGVKDPLRILHRPLPDEPVSGLPLQVRARIQHQSGVAWARLHYRIGSEGPFITVPMLASNTGQDEWIGYLPAIHRPALITYYIEAEAEQGKRICRPLPAPQGYWQLRLSPRVMNANWVSPLMSRIPDEG